MATWNFAVDLADVYADHDRPFEQRRDEIVRRIRAADFYDPQDIVLRSLVADVADTVSFADFNRHFDYLRMWGDQEHVRVWFETSIPAATQQK